MASEIELASWLEFVHSVFYVSMLRECIGDPSWAFLVVDVHIKQYFSSEESLVAILDRHIYN